MITIQIDEKPFVQAQQALKGVYNEACSFAGDIAGDLKANAKTTLAKTAYYSSFVANATSYLSGSMFNPLSFVCTGISFASLKLLNEASSSSELDESDKKMMRVAKKNILANVACSAFNAQTLKLLLTGWNAASDIVKVSVK